MAYDIGDTIIHNCPFCGNELLNPSYSMARMDASPW